MITDLSLEPMQAIRQRNGFCKAPKEKENYKSTLSHSSKKKKKPQKSEGKRNTFSNEQKLKELFFFISNPVLQEITKEIL